MSIIIVIFVDFNPTCRSNQFSIDRVFLHAVSLFSFGDPVRVLVEYKVQVNKIFHEITKLDANKSSGTDNIRRRYLK